MWQCLIWAIFDLQTSHGCLKVSEFYQESDSEDENHLRQFLKSEIKLLCFCEFLPCNSRRQPSFLNRKKLGLLTDPRCINISSLSYWQGVLAMQKLKFDKKYISGQLIVLYTLCALRAPRSPVIFSLQLMGVITSMSQHWILFIRNSQYLLSHDLGMPSK